LNVNLGLTFSQKLLEMIDTVLQLAETNLEQLDALVVVTGPGSFTGLRVGIASMKALALRLQRPLVGVTSLDALAESALTRGTVAAFMDARRGQVFAALYTRDSALAPPVMIREAEVEAPGRWIASLSREDVKFVGDGTQIYRDLIEQAGHRVIPSDCFIARSAVCSALRKLKSGDLPAADLIDAYYVRPPDAETGAGQTVKAKTR
jgi:tRNA threonylcarbamoyladenosine biosynthesis protein TsaB